MHLLNPTHCTFKELLSNTIVLLRVLLFCHRGLCDDHTSAHTLHHTASERNVAVYVKSVRHVDTSAAYCLHRRSRLIRL